MIILCSNWALCLFCHSQTQRKLASRKADYERVHDRLMHDLPKLYDGRVDFFEPCLVAMVQSQVKLD